MNKKKVAVLGGGVAGMSAAHELIQRGFDVDVYESLSIPGGKARSVPVPDSSVGDRLPLPGEHGFRFFPRFYQHVTATMKEIPLGNGKTVFDNLVDTTRIEMARFGQEPIVVLAGFPQNFEDILVILKDLFGTNTGIPDDEIEYFAERVWQIITSCSTRRLNEYEQVGWWEFIGAAERSKAYQNLLGYGLTRSLVAAQADLASTRTVGHILVLLLFNMLQPGESSDRVLNGPTNEVWIEPWKQYLQTQGVRYHLDAELKEIHCAGERIASVSIQRNGLMEQVSADYFLLAVPAEACAPLINGDMLKIDPSLENLQRLGWYPVDPPKPGPNPTTPNCYLGWMNGAQFYLYEDIPVVHGHVIYVDSPWALTSISQKQFWGGIDLSHYGDGKVKGIISVDISDWDKEGILFGKTAKECTHDQIRQEVWAQLKQSLNVDGKTILSDDNLHSWFLDPDIQFEPPNDPATPHKQNTQPLLVNLVNSWTLRPNAYTRIANLFLASDYVKTNTDLATMEGANEAARRAVNSIIDASGVKAPYCRIWLLNEPLVFKLWRYVDARRYAKGLPWSPDMPGWIGVLQHLVVWWLKSAQWVSGIIRSIFQRH